METFTIWGQKKERQVTEEYIKTNKALCMVIYISSKARRKKGMMKSILVTTSWADGKGCNWRGAHRDAKILVIAYLLAVCVSTYIHSILLCKSLAILKLLLASKYEVILSFTNERIVT